MPDAANNPGLVADCDVLLAARDTLAGSGTLNWSATTPIADWDGVRLDGTPLRIVRLDLREMGLTGSIPATLGNLSSLTYLNLRSNQLTGSIPTELGNLPNLTGLWLYENELTGTIPMELGSLTNLETLNLRSNQLTGTILAGLGRLMNLKLLHLSGNQLTGCVPAGLRDVEDNDLEQLGLSFCPPEDPLVARYDANGNGTIEKSEVIKAINDHLFGTGEPITKEQVIALINLYLFG